MAGGEVSRRWQVAGGRWRGGEVERWEVERGGERREVERGGEKWREVGGGEEERWEVGGER